MSEKVLNNVANEEKTFKRESAMLLNYATVEKFITRNMERGRFRDNYYLRYSKEQVLQFVRDPERWQDQLRDISVNLYNISSQYRRLVNYFSTMPTFAYIVEPYGFDPDKVNAKTFKTQYRKTLDFIENMNIKHEFSKILLSVFVEDVFYGYEHMSKDTYFIQKLDPKYCVITSIIDGCYNFSFNFQYFDTYPERLDTYPDEFKEKYEIYKQNVGIKYVWQELEHTNTICIKLNENISEYAFPPFAGLFESLLEIEDFKALRKSRAELENYKLLIQKLPMREESGTNNDFMIDYDNMIMFHQQAASVLPDQVGLITTPMDIKDINFEKSGSVDQDNVFKATREFWDGAGVSQLLFNTDKSSSVGLNRSINSDEALVFMLLRQFERWLNKKARKSSGVSWRVHLLNVTHYNIDDFFERVMTSGEYGFPVRSVIAATLGLTPSSLMNMNYLENEVLGLNESMVPMQSSHTSTTDGEDGAPKKKGTKITDSGAKSRDSNKKS
jgi:hypothetical protein